MKKKLLIGAGIVLTVFVIFLIAICGGASSNNIVTEEELKTIITNVSCEVKDEDDISYDLSLLTNDVSFDEQIQNKQYTKINVNKKENFKTYGVAFTIKSSESFVVEISLNKNGESLTTTTIEVQENQLENVDLILDNSVDISTTDNFDITFTQSGNSQFVFDTVIFLFDEV